MSRLDTRAGSSPISGGSVYMPHAVHIAKFRRRLVLFPPFCLLQVSEFKLAISHLPPLVPRASKGKSTWFPHISAIRRSLLFCYSFESFAWSVYRTLYAKRNELHCVKSAKG